jgi:hypothetical protein
MIPSRQRTSKAWTTTAAARNHGHTPPTVVGAERMGFSDPKLGTAIRA